MSFVKIVFLFLIASTVISASNDSEDLEDSQQVINYENTNSHPNESTMSNLLVFVEKEFKSAKKNTTKQVKVSVEQAFKNLMVNPMVEKVFKTHKNWHTWKNINWANGSKQIKYYVCYSKTGTINSPHCDKGFWKQQNMIPSCAFNIFAMINNNEVCAHAFGGSIRTVKGSSLCEEGKQYMLANIKNICNHKLHAKWFFNKITDKYLEYIIPELNILCKNLSSCEIYTTYKIKEDNSKIIFKISDKDKKPLFVKTMYTNMTSVICDGSCLTSQSNKSLSKENYQELFYNAANSSERLTAIKEFALTANKVVMPEMEKNELTDDPPQSLENWMSDSVEYSTKKLVLPWQYYERPLL